MVKKEERPGPPRSDLGLARIIAEIARSARSEAVICGTESGVLFRRLHEIGDSRRLIAATPNADTYDALSRDGFEVVRLAARVAHKYTQARYAIAMALSVGKVSPGQLIVCGIGHDLCRGGGDLVVATDVESGSGELRLTELVKLTDGIRPDTLHTILSVACKIGRVTRSGKPLGALLVLGDSRNVLKGSRQLILNPFEGHEEANRTVRNPDIHEMLVELAKLDGDVRVFSRGELVLQMDPELPLLAT